MNQGRKKASLTNFFWSYLSNIFSIVLNFALRTVLIKTLGIKYTGVGSLFTNVLGVLSLAELGISGAISFSLYKPLAENNYDKIKALIHFFRNAYRIVAVVVFVIGVSLIPFLPKIAKGSEGVEHIVVIYCIYLFNTISSYLVTYKATIITADQKGYIVTRIAIVQNIIIALLQIVALYLTKNYIIFMIISSVFQLATNIYIYRITEKKYPFLKNISKSSLSKEERKIIYVKLKALLYHKIGTVLVNQTDSIITSAVINVSAVGLVSNYFTIISVIRGLIYTFYNSMIPSIGNLLVTDSSENKYKMFKNIDFLSFWIGSFSSVSLLFLLTPFVQIWLGEEFILEKNLVILLVVNFYVYTIRLPMFSVRGASGVYEPDRLSPLIESVVNLAVSIVLAKTIGLIGVYIGTFVSSIIPVIWCSLVVFKYIFNCSSKKYFFTMITRILIVSFYAVILHFLFNYISFSNLYINLGFRLIICLFVPNLFNYLLFRKSDEFNYFKQTLLNYLNKIKGAFKSKKEA